MTEESKGFTPQEIDLIKKYWIVPPKQCNGCCDIVEGCLVSWCKCCGWDDAGLEQ